MVVVNPTFLSPRGSPFFQGGILSVCRRAPCSRPPDTSSGRMDELAAAAAVTPMSIVDYAEEDSAQHTLCAAATCDEVPLPALEIIEANQESNSGDAALQAVEDANVKVLNAWAVISCSPCEHHLARAMTTFSDSIYVPETLRASLSRNDDTLRVLFAHGGGGPISSKLFNVVEGVPPLPNTNPPVP